LPVDALTFYNDYWTRRDRLQAEARSRERAVICLDLLAKRGVTEGRLLDAGCGPGWALAAFRDAGFEVTGIDASSAAVATARSRGLDARLADLEKEPFEAACDRGAGFSVVVALEVLEHLNDPLDVLRRLLALLEPGGAAVVSLPNEIALPARLQVLFGRLPFGGHADPHLRHFDRGHARRLLTEAGARIVRERAVSVVPPRWPFIKALAAPLLALFPGLFALATIYLLEREPA